MIRITYRVFKTPLLRPATFPAQIEPANNPIFSNPFELAASALRIIAAICINIDKKVVCSDHGQKGVGRGTSVYIGWR